MSYTAEDQRFDHEALSGPLCDGCPCCGAKEGKSHQGYCDSASDNPATLTELMDAVVDGRIELTDEMDDFGGEEPDCTAEVWSWDEGHLLVGTHAGDLAIVAREHHAAEILQQRAEAMHEDRELAEKAEWS